MHAQTVTHALTTTCLNPHGQAVKQKTHSKRKKNKRKEKETQINFNNDNNSVKPVK
jgi:hypothetical protein